MVEKEVGRYGRHVRGGIVAEEDGVLSGLDVAMAVFRRVDPGVETLAELKEGAGLEPGMVAGSLNGPLDAILTAERTALNFVRRLSGVATETSKYVDAVKGTNTTIIDTRKTTPGFRSLQKYAVRMGGGTNHRQNLGDGILIKDNHIRTLALEGMSLKDVIRKAHTNASHTINCLLYTSDAADE